VFVTSPYRVVEYNSEVPYVLDIVATLDETLGRIVCSEVTVRRPGEGTEITGTSLREIAVQRAIEIVGDDMVEVVNFAGVRRTLGGSRALFSAAEGRSRNEVIADAALIYVGSSLTGRRPLAEVAAKLKVSQSTATRYVSEARKQGILRDG
jgi:hypothetical protein